MFLLNIKMKIFFHVIIIHHELVVGSVGILSTTGQSCVLPFFFFVYIERYGRGYAS